MAYDEGLAQRIREKLDQQSELVEKRMFGGIGFMLQGNLACGVIRDSLIVRVGPDQYERALTRTNTGPFDFTGKPMKGWIMVTPDGYESDGDLESWVQQGARFALSLPPK